MKIVRYNAGGRPTLGQIVDDRVHPLTGFADLQALIAQWPGGLDRERPAQEGGIIIGDVALLAPIVPTRNVFCVGWNYLSHFNESIGKRGKHEVELPERPTFFTKLPTTVVGPYDDVPLHQACTERLDWEVELAVIIGKGGRDIEEAEAASHVFGYTVANDISARDLQRSHGGQWFKGKSLDATCPLGPMVITADELGDPRNLSIWCKVNGQIMQDSHTRRQIFSVPRVIAELSAGLTLLPGDVILTGTPEGIGNARTPPVYLEDGDVVECGVEGIGTLRNTVRADL